MKNNPGYEYLFKPLIFVMSQFVSACRSGSVCFCFFVDHLVHICPDDFILNCITIT